MNNTKTNKTLKIIQNIRDFESTVLSRSENSKQDGEFLDEFVKQEIRDAYLQGTIDTLEIEDSGEDEPEIDLGILTKPVI